MLEERLVRSDDVGRVAPVKEQAEGRRILGPLPPHRPHLRREAEQPRDGGRIHLAARSRLASGVDGSVGRLGKPEHQRIFGAESAIAVVLDIDGDERRCGPQQRRLRSQARAARRVSDQVQPVRRLPVDVAHDAAERLPSCAASHHLVIVVQLPIRRWGCARSVVCPERRRLAARHKERVGCHRRAVWLGLRPSDDDGLILCRAAVQREARRIGLIRCAAESEMAPRTAIATNESARIRVEVESARKHGGARLTRKARRQRHHSP
mmetsp:Transcript_30485/g.70871  ORF Transcript_30485/g.70871 Transcript_30485/m.70871 type:complete len:265 (-) Transcript_30485:180-974(-)